jgi:hypothetical protein
VFYCLALPLITLTVYSVWLAADSDRRSLNFSVDSRSRLELTVVWLVLIIALIMLIPREDDLTEAAEYLSLVGTVRLSPLPYLLSLSLSRSLARSRSLRLLHFLTLILDGVTSAQRPTGGCLALSAPNTNCCYPTP